MRLSVDLQRQNSKFLGSARPAETLLSHCERRRRPLFRRFGEAAVEACRLSAAN